MHEFDRAGSMQRLFLRYTHALISQVMQMAVCNRHHVLAQQLCRWLLAKLDRVPSGELVMTQEQIASMLGVRREGISEAAGKLQQVGYFRYRRGHITVLDRSGLEGHACECYAAGKTAFRQLPSGGGLPARSSQAVRCRFNGAPAAAAVSQRPGRP